MPDVEPEAGPGRAGRTLALAGAEVRLFLRNRTAVVNSVLLPLLLVAAVPALGIGGNQIPVGPRLLVTAIGVTLVLLTYYNLLTTFVARAKLGAPNRHVAVAEARRHGWI